MNRLTLTALATLAFVPTAAVAQSEAAEGDAIVTECHGFERDQARLICYDRLTNYEEAVEAPTIWTLVENTDSITDADRSRVWLEVDNFGGDASPEVLVMACDGEGGFDVYVFTSGYLGAVRDRVPVTYRWNDDEPISETWSISTAGKSAFLPASFQDFLTGLTSGGRLAFQWQNYRGSRFSGIWENVQLDDNANFIMGGCQS